MAKTTLLSSPRPTFLPIPSHFDTVYYNQPNCESVLVHSYPSSFLHQGCQAILCFHSQPLLPGHLGLPKLDNYENKVFLQVASEDQPFVLQSEVALGQRMQMNVTEYLILLQFIDREWARVSAQLQCQLKTMREGTEPISISNRLVFYNHGWSHFKTSLSSRLMLKAWIESKQPQGIIHCYLEKQMDGSDQVEIMTLPMESLLTMAKDTVGFKTMTDILACYKSKTKK